ncbi:MAG: threonylcarbamoyl-AMP synthase [Alphaproteobacteria bacterium]|nr:threonylcarbamoyl-AMP synthase [Alphaproteobacteria bacterium]
MANIISADRRGIACAADVLRKGGLVAFPTETVYGLGADATNDNAVAGIFEAKGRPRFNPLIVHVLDFDAAAKLAELAPAAVQLAERFWPGPLTLVVPRKLNCPLSLLASAGLDTIALRVPAHPVARALLASSELAIASPSANRSGHVSPTTAHHVADDFGARVDFILDGGRTAHGIESTVVGFAGDSAVLLRPGAVVREDIEEIAGALGAFGPDRVSSPGQLASHYAPQTPLRLNADAVLPGEVLLAFGPRVSDTEGIVRNLSRSGDLKEAAANLFAMLRELDVSGAQCIAVMPIPDHGLGEAINDRLRRAATPVTAA